MTDTNPGIFNINNVRIGTYSGTARGIRADLEERLRGGRLAVRQPGASGVASFSGGLGGDAGWGGGVLEGVENRGGRKKKDVV
jgi:hypothetical protein